jgi:hypothetical protein
VLQNSNQLNSVDSTQHEADVHFAAMDPWVDSDGTDWLAGLLASCPAGSESGPGAVCCVLPPPPLPGYSPTGWCFVSAWS